MRPKHPVLPGSNLLLGIGYLLLWLLLWPTEQPYWMLPYGLRFGALFLVVALLQQRTQDSLQCFFIFG